MQGLARMVEEMQHLNGTVRELVIPFCCSLHCIRTGNSSVSVPSEWDTPNPRLKWLCQNENFCFQHCGSFKSSPNSKLPCQQFGGCVVLLHRLPVTIPGFLSSTLLPLFFFRVPLLKPNSRKKGTLIVKGLLRNLESEKHPQSVRLAFCLLWEVQPAKRRGSLMPEGPPIISTYGCVYDSTECLYIYAYTYR